METQDETKLRNRLRELESQVAELEDQLRKSDAGSNWRHEGYYLTYHATAGFFLGSVGAIASLLFNVVGSLVAGKHPLELIRWYLTFGLGARAADPNFDSAIALLLGVCLYIGTGMTLGILFQVAFTSLKAGRHLLPRLVIATMLALAIWAINFYVLIAFLQPRLFGGSWIVENVPGYVAAATHLVFGWTMALVYPLGEFKSYQPRTE